jgi:hypothetical protein
MSDTDKTPTVMQALPLVFCQLTMSVNEHLVQQLIGVDESSIGLLNKRFSPIFS